MDILNFKHNKIGKKAYKIARAIKLEYIDAITASSDDIKSDELLIHVENEYDYRYACGN